jgi:hypothetical protein
VTSKMHSPATYPRFNVFDVSETSQRQAEVPSSQRVGDPFYRHVEKAHETTAALGPPTHRHVDSPTGTRLTTGMFFPRTKSDEFAKVPRKPAPIHFSNAVRDALVFAERQLSARSSIIVQTARVRKP